MMYLSVIEGSMLLLKWMISTMNRFKDELKQMEQSLSTIKTFVGDAETKKGIDEAIKDWVEKVDDIAYEVDDLFDDLYRADLMKLNKPKVKVFPIWVCKI